MTDIILASTSKYRQQQFLQLGLPFEAHRPLYDEDLAKTQLLGLNPRELALALAEGKARSLAEKAKTVIGADQLVSLQGKILGKPGSVEACEQQLFEMQGQSHELITAVTVLHRGRAASILDVTTLKMRPLSMAQIKKYVKLDKAIDCAGGYKIEEHGMLLFDSIQSHDWSSIQGLPLLQLARILRDFGFDPLTPEER